MARLSIRTGLIAATGTQIEEDSPRDIARGLSLFLLKDRVASGLLARRYSFHPHAPGLGHPVAERQHGAAFPALTSGQPSCEWH